ncbi:MAG: PaaI family thioesterase [Myxococcota bacterium]
MEPATHPGIDRSLSGRPLTLESGRAVVQLDTIPAMRADDQGLVHGGFVFSAADYAAMLAVNDPHVVLGSAEVRFTAPVRVGESVVLTAEVGEAKGRKREVSVSGTVGERAVLEGTFTAFVLDRHVLEGPR